MDIVVEAGQELSTWFLKRSTNRPVREVGHLFLALMVPLQIDGQLELLKLPSYLRKDGGTVAPRLRCVDQKYATVGNKYPRNSEC